MSIKYKKQNHIRKSIFVIGIFLCLFLLGFQIVYLIQSKSDGDFLHVSLSQDLNLTEDESLFELLLEWPLLEDERFKDIQIKINDEKVDLPTNAVAFETILYEPDTLYEIEFRARHTGFGFDKRDKVTIKTGREILEQSVTRLGLENDSFYFEHTLTNFPDTFDLSSVTYELNDFWQQKSMILEPELLEEVDGVGRFKVSVPVGEFLESPTLSLKIHANNGDTSFFAHVTDTFESQMQSYDGFTLYLENGQFVLVNDGVESFTYGGHNFFAESMHLAIKESDEILTYQLVNRSGETVVNNGYLPQANLGVDLSGLDEGTYFVLVNDHRIRMTDEVQDVWYTVTRQGYANQVTVHNSSGLLAIRVEKVSELPEEVYDILVDPGHGGPDGGAQGNDLSEADEVLRISKYIAKRLEDHGLKVRLSRTGNYEPSGDETFDWRKSPYLEDGRVSQVYQYSVNYLISNHLNAFNGRNEGFEIFSSIFTSDEWSSLIASNLIEIGRTPRDSEKSLGRVSEGSFKRSGSCQRLKVYDQLFGCTTSELDSLYIIRETGGRATFASEMVYFNSELHSYVPNSGAQSILIEYAYIDHVNEATRWGEDWKTWGEAVVRGTLEYLDIEYIAKR